MDQKLPESAQRRVGDIMTKDVITVTPQTKVSEIARLMSENDVSGLPVIDDSGKILGIITELDMIVRNTRFKMPTFFTILDSIIYLETPHHFQERLEHVLGTTAEEIMTEEVITIAPEATIEALSELMVDKRISPVLVVEANRLVGIVGRSDIIRQMVQDFNQES
jgi:CBS domain-containing protein